MGYINTRLGIELMAFMFRETRGPGSATSSQKISARMDIQLSAATSYCHSGVLCTEGMGLSNISDSFGMSCVCNRKCDDGMGKCEGLS